MQDETQIRRLLEMMNRHVPSRRTSLTDLLKAQDPEYQSKDGIHYRIKRNELEYLSTIVDPWDQPKLKLPIIIMTDTGDEAGGAWKILGRVEVKVVSQIVGREPEFPDQMRLFHPHMVKLRTVLPTATTTMFSP
ncbi:MAG: DUF61 family protein [Methanomassiliicoccus sp.]|nr:DUF61 family protein [Methanomassiliicoccus sp.]